MNRLRSFFCSIDFRAQVVDGYFQVAVHLAQLVHELFVFHAIFVLDDVDELNHRAEIGRLDRPQVE